MNFVRKAFAALAKRLHSPKHRPTAQVFDVGEIKPPQHKFAGYENLGNAATTVDDVDWDEFERWCDKHLESESIEKTNRSLQQEATRVQTHSYEHPIITTEREAREHRRRLFPLLFAEPQRQREYPEPPYEPGQLRPAFQPSRECE